MRQRGEYETTLAAHQAHVSEFGPPWAALAGRWSRVLGAAGSGLMPVSAGVMRHSGS